MPKSGSKCCFYKLLICWHIVNRRGRCFRKKMGYRRSPSRTGGRGSTVSTPWVSRSAACWARPWTRRGSPTTSSSAGKLKKQRSLLCHSLCLWLMWVRQTLLPPLLHHLVITIILDEVQIMYGGCDRVWDFLIIKGGYCFSIDWLYILIVYGSIVFSNLESLTCRERERERLGAFLK